MITKRETVIIIIVRKKLFFIELSVASSMYEFPICDQPRSTMGQ